MQKRLHSIRNHARKQSFPRLAVFVGLLMLALVLGITASAPASAQGAPEAIQDALADLNTRLGLNLTLNDLNWFWSQETFQDTALGCPAEGEVPTPEEIIGYEFTFTWDAQVYTYRVSADRTILRFCGVTSEDAEEEVTREEAVEQSNNLCPEPPEGIVFMRTRLTSGIKAEVLPGLPNNLRAGASTDAQIIGELPGGAVFDVLAGPTCAEDGTLWWQVNYNGQSGFTAEGRNGEYFVQPQTPQAIATNANRPIITPQNMDTLSESARLYGNFSGGLAWSPNFTLVATGNTGSEGLWVYPLDSFASAPTVLDSLDRLLKVDFAATSDRANFAVVGGDEGSLRVWNVSLDGTLVERAFLNGHNDPVSAIAVNTDGSKMASVGGLAFVTLADDAARQNAIVLWDTATVAQLGGLAGHQDAVTGMAYEPAGIRLISTSRDGTVRLWDTQSFAQVGIIEGEVPVTAVAWSAANGQIVIGYEDGRIALIDSDTFTIQNTFTGHGGTVRSIVFSPDGALVATGGVDSRLIVWDVASLTGDDPVQTIPTTTNEGEVQRVVFSPDGTYIATMHANNLIRFWQPITTAG